MCSSLYKMCPFTEAGMLQGKQLHFPDNSLIIYGDLQW